MFLRQEYRARAMGVLAAYSVLITGIVVSGAMASEPAQPPTEATLSVAYSADDCAATLSERAETICQVC